MNENISQNKSKTTMERLKGFWFSYNVSEKELEKIELRIKEQNSRTLKAVSLITAVLYIFLTVLSLLGDDLREYCLLYFLAAIGMSVVSVYEYFFIRRFPKIQNAMLYIFMTFTDVFAITLGTWKSPDELAVVYIAVLLAQSILFVDHPMKMMGFQLSSVVMFTAAAFVFDNGQVFLTDVVNAWSIGLLSLCMEVYTISNSSRAITTEYRLESLGIMDQLTGLRNRNCYERELSNYPKRAKLSLSCVFMDVNGLHALNDKEGHEAGDRMLQFMAYGFQKVFGERDSYRIGGDEFAAICVDMGVDEIRDKIELLNRTFAKQDYHAAIGYAFAGVSRNSDKSGNIMGLIKSAEESMYREKEVYYRNAGVDARSQRDAVMALKEQSRTLAFIEVDDLSGLYTRQAFYHHVHIQLRRNPDRIFNLIMFDIDNFKYVNERYGEETGDQILRKMGNQIKNNKASSTLAGRYNSDIFALLIEQGERTTEETIAYYSRMLMRDPDIQKISLKFGIYENVEHGIPASILCDRAMMALRSIKGQYGITVARYDKKLQRKIDWENKMEASMERALKENQFQVYYQPKHDAKTGKLIGAEALIRWIHPEFGFISPGDFIPLFEKNGFITEVDYYVWENVCRDLRTWKDADIAIVPVSVNASRLDFTEDDYWERVHRPVTAYGIPKEMLHIEVTETLASENLENLVDILRKLREEGFRIEMDDFGKGYSSLNTLGTLPLDVVKLDMSFISQIEDERKFRVLTAVIGLAKNLDLRTVAEGVETGEQLKILQNLGCDSIQGFYFSKPLPKKEFTEYLKKF